MCIAVVKDNKGSAEMTLAELTETETDLLLSSSILKLTGLVGLSSNNYNTRLKLFDLVSVEIITVTSSKSK